MVNKKTKYNISHVDSFYDKISDVKQARKYKSEELKAFAERLSYLLDKHKMTFSEIYEKTGIAKSSLSSYITGTAIPRLDALLLLSRLFNVSLDYLIGLAECPAPKNEEIHKLLGLSDSAINALKNLKYVNDSVPHYMVNVDDIHVDHITGVETIQSYTYYDANGTLSNKSAKEVNEEFKRLGSLTKTPDNFYETLNYLLNEKGLSILALIAMYINTGEIQLNMSVDRHLNVHPGDNQGSPFDFSLPFGDNIPEVVMIKLIERLRDERKRRLTYTAEFVNKSMKSLSHIEEEELLRNAVDNLDKEIE